MPPASLRDQYVRGQLGVYLCPTVAAVDVHLAELRKKRPGARGAPLARLLQDTDALLDRRLALQRDPQPIKAVNP